MKQRECKNEKRRTRKRFAAWLACLMAVVIAAAALPFTALATESEPAGSTGSSTGDANKGSVTITNPKDDVTYYGYKIFDVSYTTVDGVKSYSYSIAGDSPWFTTVKGYADGTYADGKSHGLNLVKAAGTNAYVVTIADGDFSAADFANHLKSNVGSISEDFTLDKANPSKDSLPLGYYFVLSKEGDETQALCNLTTTDPDATITDKNDTTFEKKITAIDEAEVTGTDENGNTVQVGAKITYTITGKIPDRSGTAVYYYHAKDTMTKGLTFNKDVTVTIGSQTVTLTEVDNIAKDSHENEIKYIDPSDENGGGFELSLDLLEKGSGDSYKYNDNDEITVTYTATVNKDAVSKISENEAELKFGTDPDNLSDSTPQVVKTLSSEIIIDKFKQGNTDAKLAGAKFVLKRGTGADAEYYKGTFSEEGSTDPEKLDKVEWVKSADVDGASNVPDLTTSKITVVETDDNGAAVFAGLANGTYYLLEVEAPAGYNLLKDPVEVKINAVLKPDTTPDELMTGEGYTTQQVVAEVANSDGAFLPSTGGMGTTIFYVCGIALMVAAAVFFVMKKRTGAERK